VHGVIIKDDPRYEYTESFLQNKGYIFYNLDHKPEALDFVIFPFKGNIDADMYNGEYFSALKKDAVIFSGLKSAYLESCAKSGITYHAMMDDHMVKVKNAVPTSEGVIAYLAQNMGRTIAGSRILTIGYGLCGQDLSLRLRALGAKAYALVRNAEKETMAKADFITPIYLNELCRLNFDAIVNTVPGCVLANEMLDTIGGRTLLIDIASKPYGFDIAHAKKLNSKSALLPGIPGKYATATAGEILGEYIHLKLSTDSKMESIEFCNAGKEWL